ncbi:MAG: hypothetical protein K0S98_3108 [Propionibacteriaceae bacterium]|nr:hypothetical protein [Propionibacteriaceae bacterium]
MSGGERIDRIARLEQLKAAVGALQAAESVRFAESQVEQQLAAGVHPRVVGRGIADQIALACQVSPTEGSRRLGIARALWFDLPATFRLLTAGQISEFVASLVVSETRHLRAPVRRRVDQKIVNAGIAGMGPRRAAACARGHAYAADPHGYLQRGRTERRHRRVGLRPAPDTMAILSGYLPVDQGVACLAALRRHTDTVKADGDRRSRDQIMADTLVERVTGQAAAADVNVDLHLADAADLPAQPSSGQPSRDCRIRPNPEWDRPRYSPHESGPGVVAAVVHRPGRRADRGCGSVPPPLRRLAGPADQPAGPNLPRPLL